MFFCFFCFVDVVLFKYFQKEEKRKKEEVTFLLSNYIQVKKKNFFFYIQPMTKFHPADRSFRFIFSTKF